MTAEGQGRYGGTAETKTPWEARAETAWGQYLSGVERRVLIKALDLAPSSGGALEVGCEGGRWSQIIAQHRSALICVDVDAQTLRICAERLPRANCILVKPEDERFPAGDGELGLLLAYEVPPVTGAGWFPAEAARVLMPGGIAAFTYQNPASIRATANRAAKLLDRRRRNWADTYRGASYASVRRSLRQQNFEFLREDGMAWMPFGRESDSRLIPLATRLESALGLPRLPALSPWVVAIARRM